MRALSAMMENWRKKEYNLAVVKKLPGCLNKVVLRYIVREQRIVQFPKGRVRLANKRQADMLVSVHCNASDARKHSVRGIEVLYSSRINGRIYQ